MENSQSSDINQETRYYDNDWLTVLAMMTIFLFHCSRFFDDESWHVKNNQLDDGLTLFVSLVVQWIMPLFFLLSGMSSFFSLRSRVTGKYISNRFKRMVIPFLFGTFVFLIPVQVWIERVSNEQFTGSLIDFYPHYFKGFYGFGGNFAWMGLHLWYLEFLFIFTLLTLPLFILFRKTKGQKILSKASGFFEKRGAILLFGIPIFVIEWLVNLQPDGVGRRDFGGWSLITYLMIFVLGYIIAIDLRYKKGIERSRYISLIMGLLTTWVTFFSNIDISLLGETSKYAVVIFFRSFNSWFWLTSILGFGSRYLNIDSKSLKYVRKAVLPFYILHQTVIIIIGFNIINWDADVPIKFLILSTLSFTVIMTVYELLVKRLKVLRFLFGMKL